MKVAQLCLTLCNPMDYTVHGILQARILEWVAVPFSRGSSQPRDWPQWPSLQVDSLPAEPQGSPRMLEWIAYPSSSGSSRPRNRTRFPCIAGRVFINWAQINICVGIYLRIFVYVAALSKKWHFLVNCLVTKECFVWLQGLKKQPRIISAFE